METGIYAGAVVLTVLWSVYLHVTWSSRAGFPEEAGARFFLIVGPSSYLLAAVLSGWQRSAAVRLDLIGLVLLSVITILIWAVMLAYFALRHTDDTRGYRMLLILYNVGALLVVAGCWTVRLFPPVLIRITSLAEQSKSLNFFSFAWVGLNPTNKERDLVSMLNKTLIALASYLPISLIRMAYGNSKRRKIMEQVRLLSERLERLEQRLQRESREKEREGEEAPSHGEPPMPA